MQDDFKLLSAKVTVHVHEDNFKELDIEVVQQLTRN